MELKVPNFGKNNDINATILYRLAHSTQNSAIQFNKF